jgi:Spy/CpxP family protein refolding chaperone
MKTHSTFLKLPIAVIVAAFFTIAAHASAQNQSESTQKAPPRRQFGSGAAGRFSPGFERILSVLTDAQRASMRQAMEADREKIRDLEQKIREVRRELFELGLSEKFDETAVRQKASAAAKLDTEMTVLRVKAFSQIRPPLTAEQIEKIKSSARAEMGQRPEEAPRRRHDIPRDENGLPLKEQSAPAKSGDQK